MVRRRTRLPAALVEINGLNDRTLAAYRDAIRRFARRRQVTGVTIGIKETGGALRPELGSVIAIHVTRKLKTMPKRLRVPRTILGVPTDVIESNFTLSQGVTLPNPGVGAIPLRPGASIGRIKKGRAATMGALVLKGGVPHLLTADHVFRQGGSPKKGEEIVHPGPTDAVGSPTVVARFGETHFGVGAGIARLELTVGASNTALFSDVRIGPPDVPVTGRTVEKCGRTTERTRAIIQHIGPMGGLSLAMSLKPLDGGVKPISLDGDSGSVWYDPVTFAAKGLHIGVDKKTGLAVASQLTEVMLKMALSWA